MVLTPLPYSVPVSITSERQLLASRTPAVGVENTITPKSLNTVSIFSRVSGVS